LAVATEKLSGNYRRLWRFLCTVPTSALRTSWLHNNTQIDYIRCATHIHGLSTGTENSHYCQLWHQDTAPSAQTLFMCWSDRVGFVVDKVALRQIILPVLRFCPVSTIMPSSITDDMQRVSE